MNVSQYQAPVGSMESENTSEVKSRSLMKACTMLGHPMDLYAVTDVDGMKWLPSVLMPNTTDPEVDTQHTIYNLDGYQHGILLNFEIVPQGHPVTEISFNVAQMNKELLGSDGKVTPNGLSRLLDEIASGDSKDAVVGALESIPGVLEATAATFS